MIKYLSLLSLTIMILASCAKQEIDPTYIELTNVVEKVESIADFSIHNEYNQVFEKDLLEVTNNSINAVSYHWDFGNGDTSSEANPQYSYGNHGTFTVKLTITDKYGDSKESSHDITVNCLFGGVEHGSF